MKPADLDEIGRCIAANIHRYRLASGFSQQDLAFRAGLHRTQISLLERADDRMPRLITFIKLRGALEVSADDLLEGIEFEPHVYMTGGLRITGRERP
jgi:transcriptional regulator with XRE-family HTH domain